MEVIHEICKLVKQSPLRDTHLKCIRKESGNKEKSIHAFCPTQWTVRADSCAAILENNNELMDLWKWSLSVLTDSGMKAHISIFALKWNQKMAWVRYLVTRAKRLCSPGKIKKEIDNIKRFASYNRFPKWIVNKEVKRCQELSKKEKKQCDEDITTLFMFLPYIGKESEYIVKRCKRK